MDRRARELTVVLSALCLGACASTPPQRTRSTMSVITVREQPRIPAAALPAVHLDWPVVGVLSSGFGPRDGRRHDGIDIAVPEGTPVHAAGGGQVAYAGSGLRGYGNLVLLRHPGELMTVYAHNRELLVREGDSVTAGQTIAHSGQTGHATAPHVHFEVRAGTRAVDPLPYLETAPAPPTSAPPMTAAPAVATTPRVQPTVARREPHLRRPPVVNRAATTRELATVDPRVARLMPYIREVPDFPKPGILFKDITPLLGNAAAFRTCIDLLAERVSPLGADALVGIESRGFIFGAALAQVLGVGFVPTRKPGKLPWRTLREEYALEYGSDALELHSDAVDQRRVVIVDNLLATGGTAAATTRLVERAGGQVVGLAFVIELGFLQGRERLGKHAVHSLIA